MPQTAKQAVARYIAVQATLKPVANSDRRVNSIAKATTNREITIMQIIVTLIAIVGPDPERAILCALLLFVFAPQSYPIPLPRSSPTKNLRIRLPTALSDDTGIPKVMSPEISNREHPPGQNFHANENSEICSDRILASSVSKKLRKSSRLA
jgi:hypothetical protein